MGCGIVLNFMTRCGMENRKSHVTDIMRWNATLTRRNQDNKFLLGWDWDKNSGGMLDWKHLSWTLKEMFSNSTNKELKFPSWEQESLEKDNCSRIDCCTVEQFKQNHFTLPKLPLPRTLSRLKSSIWYSRCWIFRTSLPWMLTVRWGRGGEMASHRAS